MSALKKFLVFFFILGAGVAFYFFYVHPLKTIQEKGLTGPTTKTSTVHTYTNYKYGFSVEYPDPFVVQSINDEQVFIGRKTISNFEPLVFVYLVKNSPETPSQSFEEFVLDQARLVCSSQTTVSSVLCSRIDDVVRIAPFVSKSAARGQVFDLKGEETLNATNKINTIRRGPFYTFNSSGNTPNLMSFIMIGNPIGKTPEQADSNLIKSVAASLSISTPQ